MIKLRPEIPLRDDSMSGGEFVIHYEHPHADMPNGRMERYLLTNKFRLDDMLQDFWQTRYYSDAYCQGLDKHIIVIDVDFTEAGEERFSAIVDEIVNLK